LIQNDRITESAFLGNREIKLTSQQREAVFYGKGPLLIIAGAGTGKTSCITHRAAYLISSKAAKMDEILVLSFSDKAAEEMEERIDQILPYSFSDIWVSTFHSFGKRILSSHCFEAGLDPDFQVLTNEEMVVFLEENLFQLPMNVLRPPANPARYLRALTQYISRLKDEDVSPEEYMEYAVNLEAPPDDPAAVERKEFHIELAGTYGAIANIMFKKGVVDLADLVYLPLQIFRNHPMTADIYRRRFKHILVDEFQDTNHSQYQLLKLLCAGPKNITAVGDDDQSIYKFRGAAISNILNFMDDFPEAYQVVLTKNFRSPRKILDCAYRLIVHNNPYRLEIKNNIDKRLTGEEDPGAVIFHRVFDTIDSQSEFIADLVGKKKALGLGLDEIAILVRNNKDADPIIREFNMRDIPFRYSGSSGLYLKPEIRILISFFRLIADPEDSLSLFYLAGSELYRMDPASLTRLSLYADHTNRPLLEILKSMGRIEQLKTIPREGIVTAAKIVSDLRKFTDLSITLTAGRLLYEYLKQTGYLGRLTRQEISYAELKTRNIALFFDIIKRFEGVSDYPYAAPFIKHLNNLIRAGDDPAAAQVEVEMGAVSILTVHKAKGLEFPVVIIASLAEGNFPTRSRSSAFEIPDELVKERQIPSDFHTQEERRLFYVAMTRSKRELYLLGARNLGGKRNRKISRFMMEALDIPMKSVSVKAVSAGQKIGRFSSPPENEDKSRGREIPLESLNLTPYKIDDYLTCPLKYKYVHVLRVPVMQHHSVVYGKALRAAVQEVLKRKANELPIEEENLLEIFSREWSLEGFLSREHEEIRYQEGQIALKKFFREFPDRINNTDLPVKDYHFYVDEIKVSGQWDLLKTEDGNRIILDFRASNVRDEKQASRKARKSIKNEISILAYREIFGENPIRLESYFLNSGITGKVKPSDRKNRNTIDKIRRAAHGISNREYAPQPEYYKCLYCAYREICQATAREL